VKRCLGFALQAPALIIAAGLLASQEPPAAPLPPGVRAVWDLAKAHRETSPTRERISINGLWRFQPAEAGSEQVPAGRWGWFKVPGCWPGITDYMKKDCQTVFFHGSWKDTKLRDLRAAWYEREIAIPGGWGGRRITLHAEYVNSRAAVYVDGRKAGEIRFPAGEVDLTPLCRPGANLGAAGETPLLDRFKRPVDAAEKRWLSGFYLDEPQEWDDPYRFFRW